VAESLAIPWFIFSDGEVEAVTAVKKALGNLGLSLPHNRVVVLPNDKDIERYLIDEGYQIELKQAVIEFLEPTFANDRHREAKVREVNRWSDEDLYNYLKAWKTKLSPYWSQAIASRTDERRLPRAVRDLLDHIDGVLEPSSELDHES
jgi:putative ATP-dependent endonuclease of OLD family